MFAKEIYIARRKALLEKMAQTAPQGKRGLYKNRPSGEGRERPYHSPAHGYGAGCTAKGGNF